MKKLITLLAGFILLPKLCLAIEQMPPPIHFLSDSSSFTLAKAVKLGRQSDGGFGGPGKIIPGPGPKEAAECSSHSDCGSSQVCSSGKCVDVDCLKDNDCDAGKICTSSNTCVDACSLKTCSGSTPECRITDMRTAVCSCTDNSCGTGKRCVSHPDYNPITMQYNYRVCANCSEGDACGCPDGQVADGNGGCKTEDKCQNNTCSGTTPVCTPYSRGYVCGCSTNSCAPGNKCAVPCDAENQVCVNNPRDAEVLFYNCVWCSDGETTGCGCPTGQVADGDGGCRSACTPGQTDCALCSSGQIWDGEKCRLPCDGVTCPTGYQCLNGAGTACCTRTLCPDGSLPTSTGHCVATSCGANCTGCLNASTCSGCSPGYTLSNGKCVSNDPCASVTCPTGLICQNGVCGKMCLDKNCSTATFCNYNTNVCTSDGCCIKGYSNAGYECRACATHELLPDPLPTPTSSCPSGSTLRTLWGHQMCCPNGATIGANTCRPGNAGVDSNGNYLSYACPCYAATERAY